MNYTYLLRCADGSLYCGWTNHLIERIEAHNTGKGAKYTRGRGPVTLVWYQSFATKEEAMKKEAAVKKLTKAQKEALACERGGAYACAGAYKDTGFFEEPPLRIIVSPAKRMEARPDDMPWRQMPEFLEEAGYLLARLKEYKEDELKALFRANTSITHENYLRYRDMDLSKNLTAAILTYIGIQYQYMSPRIFSGGQWDYVCEHLRILSGFYGVLRADDGIVPYRLEMQAAVRHESGNSLYEYWGDKLYKSLLTPVGCRILNLASKEYSKVIEPYLQPGDRFVTCVFGTEQDGRVKVKATEAKMARGEMVRFMAETGTMDFAGVRAFDRLDFSFCPERSTEKEFVFIKGKKG